MSETNDMILNDKEENVMDLEMEKALVAGEPEAVSPQNAKEMEPAAPVLPTAEAETEPEDTAEAVETAEAKEAAEPEGAAEEAAGAEPITESENVTEVKEVADVEPVVESEDAAEVGEMADALLTTEPEAMEAEEPEAVEPAEELVTGAENNAEVGEVADAEPAAKPVAPKSIPETDAAAESESVGDEFEDDLQEGTEPESIATDQDVIEQALGNVISESERNRRNAIRRREHMRRMRLEAPLDEKGKPITGSLSSFDPVFADISMKKASEEVLTGTIEEIKMGRNGRDGWVETLYENYRVLIPFNRMGVTLEQRPNESEQAYRDRMSRIIRNMLGAQIDYVITGSDYDSKLIAGSRAVAAAIRRRTILNARDREGNFLIYPGRKVKGNVLAVYPNVALIDVYGMIARLKAKDIRADYVADVRDEIQNGMTVSLYITDLKRDENGKVTWLYISMRNDQKEKEQIENQLAGMKPGDEFIGRVTGRSRRAVFITLNNGLQALAYISDGIRGRRIPNHGDRVAFRMLEIQTNKVSGNPIVVGRIVRTINYDAR